MLLGLPALCACHSTLDAQQNAAPASAGQSAMSVWNGVYTHEQATRGEALYLTECAECHRPDLGGGDEAPALAGSTFMFNWHGLTLGDLLERIRVSMPQANPGRVSLQQKADILAYILRVNAVPAGTTELTHETERLKQIQFQATKP
jgi:mono/diheme cytochrome c family protein